jgi:hypothetical protein
MRRKLEAKRRLGASGQDGNEKRFARGNVKQGVMMIKWRNCCLYCYLSGDSSQK